jgi:hypothetical protein
MRVKAGGLSHCGVLLKLVRKRAIVSGVSVVGEKSVGRGAADAEVLSITATVCCPEPDISSAT